MPLEGTGASEQRSQVGAVEVDAFGFVDSDQTTQSGEKINDSSRLLLDSSAGDPIFPVEDAGDAMSAFEQRTFLPTQDTISLLQVTTVVGGVDNDGVVELAEFFESGNESPNRSIGIVDGATVDGFPFFEPAILGNNFVGRRDGVMRFIEPEIEKERFVAVPFLIEPGKCLIDDDLAGITLDGSNSLSITEKIGRVFVAWARTVDHAEPVVKSVIGRGRVVAIMDGHAEVPLAKVSGGIAVFFERLGDRRFAFQEVHPVKTLVKDRVDSGAMMVTPRQKSGARGRTSRGARVEVGESHATRRQLVENRGLDRTVVAADVAVTQIVNIEGDDVGSSVFASAG